MAHTDLEVPPRFGSARAAEANMVLAAASVTPEASASWVNSRRVMRPLTAAFKADCNFSWVSFMFGSLVRCDSGVDAFPVAPAASVSCLSLRSMTKTQDGRFASGHW